MARNPKRVYRYPVFDPCSFVWQRLMEDAARTGKAIDDLIVIRLADFYGGERTNPVQVASEAPINVAHAVDTSANALAAAQAWGNDDEDTPTMKMAVVGRENANGL